MRHQLGKDEEKGSLIPSATTVVDTTSSSPAGGPAADIRSSAAGGADANGKDKKMPTQCQIYMTKASLFMDKLENAIAVVAMMIMVSGFLIYVHRRAEQADRETVVKALANMTAGDLMAHAQTLASEAVSKLQNASLDDMIDGYTSEINEHVGYVQQYVDSQTTDLKLATAEKLGKLAEDLRKTVAESKVNGAN